MSDSRKQLSAAELDVGVRACVAGGADLVYLFGSQASGKRWAESDIDFAVLLGPGVPRERYGKVQLELIGKLMSALGADAVDVVILNTASPVLAYEGVVRGGKVLFAKDSLARIRFEVAVFQRYADTAHLRDVQNQYLYRAIQARAAQVVGEGGHSW